jgi:hypothetical protein
VGEFWLQPAPSDRQCQLIIVFIANGDGDALRRVSTLSKRRGVLSAMEFRGRDVYEEMISIVDDHLV